MGTHQLSSREIFAQLPTQVCIATGDIHIDAAAVALLVLVLCMIRTK